MNNLPEQQLFFVLKRKAGSEEPAIHGIIKYDQIPNTPQKLYRT